MMLGDVPVRHRFSSGCAAEVRFRHPVGLGRGGVERRESTLEIDIALCLPREAETVGIVRDVAVLSLMRLGVTKACAEDIRIALSEACTNVVDHSEAEDQYEVRLQVDGRRCEVRVIDTGRGFDVMSLSAAPVASDSPRGRGISLMHALVDSIGCPSTGPVERKVRARLPTHIGTPRHLHGGPVGTSTHSEVRGRARPRRLRPPPSTSHRASRRCSTRDGGRSARR